MPIANGNTRLVLQGYEAWLHDQGLQIGRQSALAFADLMTHHGTRDYEGMTQEELETILPPVSSQ